MKKREIEHLYFINNVDENFYIKFNLYYPISWKDYFELSKLLMSSFVKYQINKFTDSNSNYCCFLLADDRELPKRYYDCTEPYEYGGEVNTSYKEIKAWLCGIKREVTKRYKILTDYQELDLLNRSIDHIEYLSGQSEHYLRTCFRQNKSPFKKKIRVITEKYRGLCNEYVTALDLVKFFYREIDKKWSIATSSILFQDSFTQIPTVMDATQSNSAISLPTQTTCTTPYEAPTPLMIEGLDCLELDLDT